MLDSACFATRRCGVSRRRSKCESLTRVTRRPLRYVTRMLPYSHLEVTRKSLAIAAGSSERPGRGAPSFSYTASVHCATVDIVVCARLAAASLQAHLDLPAATLPEYPMYRMDVHGAS